MHRCLWGEKVESLVEDRGFEEEAPSRRFSQAPGFGPNVMAPDPSAIMQMIGGSPHTNGVFPPNFPHLRSRQGPEKVRDMRECMRSDRDPGVFRKS